MTTRGALRWVAPAVLGAIIAVASCGLIPSSRHQVGPAQVALKTGPGLGHTVVEVPPFGRIEASTHASLVDLHMVLAEVDPRALAQMLARAPNADALIDDLDPALRRAARAAGVRTVLWATLIGGLVAALLPRRRWATIGVGAAGGLLGMSSALGLGAATYDFSGFEQPEYSGILERAPQFISAVREEAGTIDQIPSRFEAATGRLVEVLRVLSEPITDPHAGTTAILHISDIHSNPIGLEITRQLAEQFQVAAIIDTGDLTSFGDPVEARLTAGISTLGVPYLFVPGNHDSVANREALDALPNVAVMNGQIEQVAGVRVLGWADPTFTARGEASDDAGAQLREGKAVASTIRAEQPDILAVHNAALASASYGDVPLVLAGHGHKGRLSRKKETIQLEVGSTGATGIGSFLVEDDLPYEAEIIYMRQGFAVAFDYVRFWGLGRDFQIERRDLR